VFELEKSSLFFEQMASEHPALVQNIEVIYENRNELSVVYHQPQKFILSLNNLLRSLLFLMEYSLKNSPEWLKDEVSSFRNVHSKEYEILKYLRNVSAHQKLILPDESLVSGLYRIKSNGNYLLKLGFGDHNKPGKYSRDFTLNNTENIFHDILVFSSLAFMDLEHAAIGECLGVTRRWFFKVKFKTKKERFDETIDVHAVTIDFATKLLNGICNAYAKHKGVLFQDSFKIDDLGDHNCVNTVLEIDIYPSLFSTWWEDDCSPLNYGVRTAIAEGRRYKLEDEYYSWAHENLTANPEEYIKELGSFLILKPDDIFESVAFRKFCSVICMNHWHFKKAFPYSFGEDATLDPVDVLRLQKIGNMLIEEYKKQKLCTIMSMKEQLDDHIKHIISTVQEACVE
jgi:hypothetical protein